MENKFSKIIEANRDKIQVWTKALNDQAQYNSTRFRKDTTIDEIAEITDRVAAALGDISDIAIKSGAYKDTFDNSKMYLRLYGPSLIIRSNKTGVTFYLETDEIGISLRTRLGNIENVNYMDDDFWISILKLSDFGIFELEENEFYGNETTKKYGNIYNSDKSIIFRVLRNYFVGVAEESRDIISGDFKISWTSEYSIEDIMINCCKAFKALYNLNYSLWKVSELRDKKGK